MNNQDHRKLTPRVLAGAFTTAAFCLYTGAVVAAGETGIGADASAEGSVQASQSAEVEAEPTGSTRANASVQSGAGLRVRGSYPDSKQNFDTSTRGSASGNQESSTVAGVDSGKRPEPDLAAAGEAATSASSNVGTILESVSASASSADSADGTDDELRLAGAGEVVADASGAVRTVAGEVVTEASGAVGAAAETGDVTAIDAAVASALEGEITGSIDRSVQNDIKSAIETDLASDIAASLPLPGNN